MLPDFHTFGTKAIPGDLGIDRTDSEHGLHCDRYIAEALPWSIL